MVHKNIPEIRFDGFSEEWEYYLMKEITTKIGDGLHGTPIYVENTGNFFINGNNLINGVVKINEETKEVTDKDLLTNDKKLSKNSLLISLNGTIGNIAFCTEKNIMLSKSIGYLNFEKKSKFTFQYLQTLKCQSFFKSELTGSTIKNLSLNTLRETPIFIPNNQTEQTKIGSFFENIDQLLNQHQTQHKKLKALKKAMLSKLFPKQGETIPEIRFKGFFGDWEEKKLGEVVDNYDNKRIPIKASLRANGKTPYYGANGIQDFVKGYTHNGEFILIAEDGANDLNNYPTQYAKGKIWANNHVHVLAGKKNVLDTLFLTFRIKILDISKYLVGGGRAKLNAGIMNEILFSIPNNIEEQQKIGAYFQNLDSLIENHEKQIEKLSVLKKACLSKMFV